MKKHRYLALLILTLALIVTGCQQAATPTATVTEEPTAEETSEEIVLTVVGLDGSPTKEFTMSEIHALPSYEGWGGWMTSTGRINAPEKYTGVPLTEVADLVGGLEPGTAVRVVAEDGYAMTISHDQIVNGDFIVYDPGTGEETTTDERLHVVLAYARNGEPLPDREDGNLRMMILNQDQTQVVDGHWSVKWVREIHIKSLEAEWNLTLTGAITEEMDRNTFESGAAPDCHETTWEDDHAMTWSGIPLWLLVGRVDDDNKHEGAAFNRDLAEQGYMVDIVAEDGYTVSLSSDRFAENDDIIVAHLVNSNPLDEGDFPLRLVGEGLEGREMVSQIVKIVVHPPEEIEETEEPTPEEEETEEPESAELPECDGALLIAGKVGESACWTMEDLQAMEIVERTVEHPKKGAQTYTGLLLNALLDVVEPQDDASTLVITAGDGYNAEVALSDVRACEDCLIGFHESGDLTGVMPGFDSFAWVKDVEIIEVR
ncbi:MAG: molybdopterin-dependent oxidoreductase [Anaerolineae bacterium]